MHSPAKLDNSEKGIPISIRNSLDANDEGLSNKNVDSEDAEKFR